MNLGSWIVLFVLIAIVALIIRGMIRDKKKGKGGCNCGCDCGCGSGSACPNTSTTVEMARSLEERFGKN